MEGQFCQKESLLLGIGREGMYMVLPAPSFHTHIEIFAIYEIFIHAVITLRNDLANMVNIVQLWK